jgi:predicted DNA-binding protein (MmcQ/YjbR family)
MALPDAEALSRLRSICLALPQAIEKETWEAPTFRIRDKIFAMVHNTDGRPSVCAPGWPAAAREIKTHADGRPSVWCKAPPGAQAILLGAAPDRVFRPPYVGPKGWIGVWLDGAIDWQELADLIERSYRMTAPKRLLSNPADTPASPSRRKSPPSRRP